MIRIVEKAAEKNQRKRNEAIMPRHFENKTSGKEEVVCVSGAICIALNPKGELIRRYMF